MVSLARHGEGSGGLVYSSRGEGDEGAVGRRPEQEGAPAQLQLVGSDAARRWCGQRGGNSVAMAWLIHIPMNMRGQEDVLMACGAASMDLSKTLCPPHSTTASCNAP